MENTHHVRSIAWTGSLSGEEHHITASNDCGVLWGVFSSSRESNEDAKAEYNICEHLHIDELCSRGTCYRIVED